MSVPLKILVIRLSSIGDIVLTSPVVRCLKKQLNAEVHFLTNKQHQSLLEYNPYIDSLYNYENDISKLKTIEFDWIIDLHHNLKTFQLKRQLKGPSKSFHKLNIEKFMLTTFRWNILPDVHIVDRYLDVIAHLGVTNDNQGLDFFLPKEVLLPPAFHLDVFTAVVIGGQHSTKIMPLEKLVELCHKITSPFVLVGGPEDKHRAEVIIKKVGKGVNGCGVLSIFQSAYLIKQARSVITHDTGMMHIAAAFKKNITSVWGNTSPSFGMYPYQSDEQSRRVEVQNLSCRPCSKIGFSKCPKGHFKCMNMIDVNEVLGE